MKTKPLFLSTFKTETQWCAKSFIFLPILAGLALGFSGCTVHRASERSELPYLPPRPCGKHWEHNKNSAYTHHSIPGSCLPHLISSPQDTCEDNKKPVSRDFYPAKLDPDYSYLRPGCYDRMQSDFRHPNR